MRTYRERPTPHPALACAWTSTVTASNPTASTPTKRIVPDGCADVIWHRETGDLLVAGPDTRGHVSALAPGTLVAVRFRPGHAPAGLGVPADAVRDARVDLAEVWRPSRARWLADALAATRSVSAAADVLAAAAAGTGGPVDPAAPRLVALVRRGHRVSAVADAVGLTERQLHRRCLAAFGYGAKTLQRVLRFDGALRLAWRGVPAAEIAHGMGYADQAHLSREVKALAGVPLTRLL